MRHPFFDVPVPHAIAHRGAGGEAPENTLPAFELAWRQGVQILESDVHPTADGVAVLLHDERLDRTTNGSGLVTETSSERLYELDAGHRFSVDDGQTFPARGQGIRVPTLAEALEALTEARFNLEIKAGSPEFIESVVELVMETGAEDRTLLTAGEDPVMADLRPVLERTGAKVAQGASLADVVGFVRAASEGGTPPPEPMALQIPADFGGRPLVTRELVEFAHAHDVLVHVWTINEPAEIERLLDLGVDGLVSDFPRRVIDAIERRAAG